MHDKLEARKAEIEANFKDLESKKIAIVEQGKELQRQHNELQAEQVRLDGAFREIEKMLKDMEEKKG